MSPVKGKVGSPRTRPWCDGRTLVGRRVHRRKCMTAGEDQGQDDFRSTSPWAVEKRPAAIASGWVSRCRVERKTATPRCLPDAPSPRGIEPPPGWRNTARMKKTALLRHLLACLLLLLPVAALAKPGLWVVRDADTTIYLFGTVHMLPKDTDWHYPALDQALERSQVLYVEITDDDPATMTALVLRYGLDPAHPLSGMLNSFQRGRLEHAARLAGIPGGVAALDRMRPWLAALTLSVAPLAKAGMDPKLGVDKQLRAAMVAAGKPVRALETAEQQIRFLADMPRAMQLALLRSTLRNSDTATVELSRILAAWQDGDDAALARLENELMRREEPQLYEHLLVERNKAWALRIERMLQQPGTLFIAVGAAHLAGPDSVQARLREQGVAVERVPAPQHVTPPAAGTAPDGGQSPER